MQNHAAKPALLCDDMQDPAWKFVHFDFSYRLVMFTILLPGHPVSHYLVT
jgi:hypothetical protein